MFPVLRVKPISVLEISEYELKYTLNLGLHDYGQNTYHDYFCSTLRSQLFITIIHRF